MTGDEFSKIYELRKDSLMKQFYSQKQNHLNVNTSINVENCELKLDEDSVYEGQTSNNMMNGIGRIVFNNGTIIDGKWTNGKKDGILKTHNKDIFRIETYEEGVLNGGSIFEDDDGYRFLTDYKDGEIIRNIKQFPNGNIFKIR